MATPRRSARTRGGTPMTVLPALPVKSSLAYGSSGKAELRTQVGVAAGAGFEGAFVDGRGSAVPSTTGAMGPPPVPDRARTAAGGGVGGTTASNITSVSRPATGLQGAAAYAPPPAEAPPPPPPQRDWPESWDTFMWYFQLFCRIIGWPLFFFTVAHVLCIFIFGLLSTTGLALTYMPMSESWANRREGLFIGAKLFTNLSFWPDHHLEFQSSFNKAIHYKFVLQNATNQYFDWRLDQLESNITRLLDRVPDTLMLERVDGELRFPPEFWIAVSDDLARPDSQFMHRFLDANRAQIDNQIHEWSVTHEIVNKHDMEIAIRESTAASMALVTGMLQESEGKMFHEMKRIARSVALQAIEGSAAATPEQLGIDTLAHAHIIANLHRAMQETNFFSPGLGADIDWYLTSPTLTRANSWAVHLYGMLFGPHPHEPIEALRRWEEATDCWCARPDPGVAGMAQLGVKLPQPIVPKTLIIEHVPASGTRDIAAAPRNWELWAHVGSAAIATEKAKAIETLSPSMVTFCSGPPPGPGFVCIAHGEYLIHSHAYAQQTDVSLDVMEAGIATDRVVFRTMDNWGADHTCLYRLLLTGHEVEET